MPDRVRYEGMVHLGYLVFRLVEWKNGDSTREPFFRFFCTEMLHPVKSAEVTRADADCMTCLVTRARKER